MSDTKDRIAGFLSKTKTGIKNAASTLSQKTKSFCVKTKSYVSNKIDNHQQEKERKHLEELADYKQAIDNAKETISDSLILDFINNLGVSPTELYSKTVKKIQNTYPVPTEQTILWACLNIKTNRTGGIAVTDKGVFIKTLVTVYEEKALKKENRKVAELYYYPWDMLDMNSMIKDTAVAEFSSIDNGSINSFRFDIHQRLGGKN